MSEDFSPNTTLSHYRIVSKLGAGGMGEVYLAQDTKLDRKVALKILPEAFASDAERMRRFVLEAKSASALNHPNIITIYEIGEASSEGIHFIATEYIEGRTLNSCGSLTVATALDVATQVVSALQAAHSAGIIHRDIKPENVIVRPDGLVKILDFGIAKVSGPVAFVGVNSGLEAATAVKSGTSAGMIIGTASYMSPEQARGKATDARTDIFSVGVVLYEMLARRKPFTGENAMDVIASIVADEATPLTQIIPTLPPEIERIVNKALKKNLAERYQSASELLVDLKAFQKRLEFEAELQRTATPAAQAQIKKAETIVPTERRNSIAVLPFANMSTDAENEYFCDGLAEELLNALAKIDDLKVAARTSSFAFKGRNANVSDIGRALSVRTVLEGSVRKSGDRVRITVQLINTSDGYHLWSERYDREMQDIFDVQDEITLAVVDALKVRLLGDEKEALLKRYTNNAEAYQLYLRGRFFFFKRTPDGFKKAIAYFEQAIELDPDYALAHSGLADCYTFLGFYEIVAPSEAFAKVRLAAYKSVELDCNLAETRTSMAIFMILYEWDFRGSIEEFAAATRINPRYALAHHLHSACLAAMGLTPAAVAAESLAAELEPFTAIFSASLGWWHYLGHQYEEAVNQSLRTIEIAPNHFFAHWVLGITYGQTSRYEEAIKELQEADRLSVGSQHVKADMARIYAKMGRTDEARKILDDLRAQSANRYISSVTFANIFVGLDDKERVLEFLEKAYEERAVRLPYFLPDPCLDVLRSDPRFQAIRRRVGLPEQVAAPALTNQELEAHTVLLKSSEIRTDGEESGLKPAATTTAKAEPTEPATAPPLWNSTRRVVLLSVLLLILSAIGIGGYQYFSNRSTKQIESIAVMPFVNEGGNSEVEYLSDGMTEALIGSLSQLPNLNVKARSTVFRYKGKEANPQSIGKELNVQAILNGRVAQRGDRLMLSLELIDAQTENVIWSDRYDRKQTDLISLQNEIARDVSSKLKIKLSGADQQKLTKTYTTDPEVYRLYLQGRFYWNKRTKREVEKAVTYFKQSVEKDPNFALGYVGLADSSEDQDRPTKKEYIRRALDIDDNLAEAHASLGYQYMCAQDWVASERELKRAIELNPNYAQAYAWNGARLMMIGKYNESLVAIQRALEIDPTANGINFYKGVCLAVSGRRDEAIQQFKKMIDTDPTFPWTHNFLSRIYRWNGDHAASVEERAISLELDGDPGGAKRIRDSFANGGWNGFQRMLRERNAGPMALGELEEVEKDKTIETLTRHANEGSFWLFLIKVDSTFDSLRSDPRFQELLKRFEPPR